MRSYSVFKVRRGGLEEIPLVQGKVQRLHFAGAAVKRFSMTKENCPETIGRSPSGDEPLTARRALPRSRPAPRTLSCCRSPPPQVTPAAGHAPSPGPPRHARHAGPASQPGVGRGRADASRASTYALQRLSPRPGRAHPGRGSGRPRPRLVSPDR
ncbi:translation initiation factor IF-2-like [Moschus berezovskii]|uniref:translation initiation factor IF-2-like n=1 Tax=Moschus berezovskii TaxID=68408 RepID=UPI0024450345|nr:translation initiation factor IF-2-like [Moschus berezovskii]